MLNYIRKHQSQFFITKIIAESYLKKWQRTAFSWTNLPNSVCLAMDKNYLQQAMDNPNITGIITTTRMVERIPANPAKAIIVSKNADQLFYHLHNQAIHNNSCESKSPETSQIHPSVQLAETAHIGQNVTIGKECVIHPGCQILDNTIIGDNCTIFNQVTIGTEGFFSKSILDRKTHIKHFGGVKIGNNCIIHTGTNISRSVNWNEFTELASDVHIGIHTNIGHDCKIGMNTNISAKAMLAGRVVIGQDCWLGASSTISNAIKIGDKASIKIGSVVIENVDTNQEVSGHFAMPHLKNLKQFFKRKSKS